MSLKASSSEKVPMLLILDPPPRDEERERFIKGDENLVKGSAMTKRGAYAAISYMSCAGAYLLYMLASMASVRGVNVPMYTTLRRTTVVFTMIMEYILAGQRYTSPVVGSVALIVLGAFIAGAHDLSFDTYGYSIVFLANITTAIYLATIARTGKSSGLNSFGLMWCNGCVALFLYNGFLLELLYIP